MTDEEALKPYFRTDKNHQHLVHPSAFYAFGRGVIGLWLMGLNDPYEISSVLHCTLTAQSQEERQKRLVKLRERVRKFLKLVAFSNHPIMETIRYNGVPRGCGACLPEGKSVVCPICRRRVNVVPCVQCTPLHLDDVFPPQQEYSLSEGPLLPASHPTSARPGSWEKIEAMRQRVERGESCFHPLDETNL
jgi:hypothetical protein